MLVTETEIKTLWDFPVMQKVVCYLKKETKKSATILKMEEVEVSNYLEFVEHFCLQNTGADWKVNHALRFFKHVLSEGANLKDAFAYPYSALLRWGAGFPRNDDGNSQEDEQSEESGRTVSVE